MTQKDTDSATLLDIAYCPIALELAQNPDQNHPCGTVVRAHLASGVRSFQLPEPWNGDIARAPILFVSTNPAVSSAETYPTVDEAEWPKALVVDFFGHRFGGGQEAWTFEGRRARQQDGTFAPSDGKFWSQVQGKARDILGREPIRGLDWAITEVVHCKSADGAGVPEALSFCSQRYLNRVVAASGSRLVVCFGRKRIWSHIREAWALPDTEVLVGPTPICGLERYVAFLDHPGAGSRHLSKQISSEQLVNLRTFIGD